MVFAELAKEVRAEGHRQAGFAHDFQRAQAAAADGLDLGELGSPKAECLAFERKCIVGHQRRHGDAALFGSEPGGLGLDEIAMLERMHTELDAAADGLVGIDMGGDVEAGVVGLLHHGCDFVARILNGVDRVIGRGHTAIGHDLDEVRALLDHGTAGRANVVDAIDDEAHRTQPVRHDARAVVGPLPEVRVPARPGQPHCADDQAWPVDQSFLYRQHETVIGAAQIAQGGESAHQRLVHHPSRAQRRQGAGGDHVAPQIKRFRDNVHVAVDEAGHERLAGQVDDLGIGGAG